MTDPRNPMDDLLRTDRIPHIFCQGCGVGVAANCFTHAIASLDMDLHKLVVVSGIGCTGRVAGYVKLDSFHTTHGRAIPFATGLAITRPDLKVVVFSGDGDLTAIGGNHFIHAARRNVNLTVICVNNFNYAMTGGQVAPTTPLEGIATTTPYGNTEPPFNLPFLADSVGAVYVARWTVYHVRQTARAMAEAIRKKGFSFVEVLAPCPTLYLRRNRLGSSLDAMKNYKERGRIQHAAATNAVGIEPNQEIILGRFVDKDRRTWRENYDNHHRNKLGTGFVSYGG